MNKHLAIMQVNNKKNRVAVRVKVKVNFLKSIKCPGNIVSEIQFLV